MTANLNSCVLRSLLSALAISAWAISAQATPSRVDRAGFSAILARAQAVVIEALDYERHGGDNPYHIANGTLRSTATERSGTLPRIGQAPCAGDSGPFESNALDVSDPGSTSVFSDFPEGTTIWATQVCFLNPEDVLEVTVVGGSGTLTFTAAADTLESFLGFEDGTGITSVAVRNLGADGTRPSSYFYDEITTARADR